MADEPLKFEYRISRETGIYFAFGSLILAAVATAVAIFTTLSDSPSHSRWEWAPEAVCFLVCAVGSVVLARWSIRAFSAGRRLQRHVMLMKDRIVVPSLLGVFQVSDQPVKFEHLTNVVCVESRGNCEIYVLGKQLQVTLYLGMFTSREEFDAFQVALLQKLEAHGVPVTHREPWFSRPQFSLRFLLLVTTLVAAGLGSLAAFGVSFDLEFFLLPMLLIIFFAGFVAAKYGPWWVRALVFGFAGGIGCECFALLVLLQTWSSGLAMPGGGPLVYPFSSLLWQDMPLFRTAQLANSTLMLKVMLMAGPAFSGLFFALLTIGVLAWARKRRRKSRRR